MNNSWSYAIFVITTSECTQQKRANIIPIIQMEIKAF